MTKYKKNKKLKLITLGIISGFLGIVASSSIVKNNKYQQVKADNESITITNTSNLYSYLEYAKNNNIFTLYSGTYYTLNVKGVLTYTNENVNNSYTNDIIDYDTQYYNTDGYTIGDVDGLYPMMINQNGLDLEGTAVELVSYVINKTGTNTDFYNYVQNQQTPTPPSAETLGNSIIDAIRSGLELIADLASEFLVGFSALFWNTTNSTLTTFGMFSLIMLGVAVSFAVIKLVLAILRSNTGA